MELVYPGLDDFLKTALDEDIGTGDITTNCCVPPEAYSSGSFIMKEAGVICGLGVLKRVFELLDTNIKVTATASDGDTVESGAVVAKISGPARPILTGERLALNLLQHMSGVATSTAQAVRQVAATGVKIKDTRKTTPGLRALDKYAVRCGGGTNHRFNLADGVLIKDNHIKAAGGITNAINLVAGDTDAKKTKHLLRMQPKMEVEVETETLEQVEEALSAGANIIMLDNMPTEMMKEAVKLVGKRALTEASGNMGKQSLQQVAETGVDFISIGSLTHSVKALDISLRFE